MYKSIVLMSFTGQLNTKDPAAAQATPTSSLRRTGTILSKASALSQFSNYGEFVTLTTLLLGRCVTCHVSTAESDDYAEVSANEAHNGKLWIT